MAQAKKNSKAAIGSKASAAQAEQPSKTLWVSFPPQVLMLNTVEVLNGFKPTEALADFTAAVVPKLLRAMGCNRLAVQRSDVLQDIWVDGVNTKKKGLNAYGTGLKRLQEAGLPMVVAPWPEDGGNKAWAFAQSVGATAFAGIVCDGKMVSLPAPKGATAYNALTVVKKADSLAQVDGRPVVARLFHLGDGCSQVSSMDTEDAVAWVTMAREDTARYIAEQADKKARDAEDFLGGANGSTRQERQAEQADRDRAALAGSRVDEDGDEL